MIPRATTLPVRSTGQRAEEPPKKLIANFQTAPTRAEVHELSDIYARNAEIQNNRGEHAAATSELKRVETLQRVKFALQQADIDINESFERPQQEGLIGRTLTSLKSAAGARHRKPDRESEERRLLREFRKTGQRAIGRETFKELFKLRGEHFAEKLFSYLANGTDYVLDEEIVSVLVALERGSFEDKVAFLWSFISSNGDSITREELKQLLKASASEGNLSLNNEATESLAAAFFVQAGCPDAPSLTQDQFKNALEGRKELVSSLRLGSLKSSTTSKKSRTCFSSDPQIKMLPWYERPGAMLAKKFRIEDVQMFFFLLLIILGELAGFAAGFVQNDSGPAFIPLGWSLPVAKGAARSIQVLLIVFPFTVARNLITALRSTFLGSIFPLNEHLKVHGHLAAHFFFWAIVHSIAHFINAARINVVSRYAAVPPQIPSPGVAPIKPVPHWLRQETQVTGLLMFAIMLFGYFFVAAKYLLEKARQKRANRMWQMVLSLFGNFEAFYFSHLFMAISLLVLLIIHPVPYVHERLHKSTTWWYLLAGTAVYLLERTVRIVKQFLWKTRVRDIVLIPNKKTKVVELRLEIPRWAHKGWRGFNYRPGQYAFINIPAISRWEWHPFSISSAPNDDYICFHIGAVGDWTTSLYELSERALSTVSNPRAPQATNAFVVDEEAAMDHANAKADLIPPMQRDFFKVRLDGPFGAPAQDYSKHKTVLLIGAGIGVTPMASVLKQLVSDFNASKCWNCKCANHKLFGVRKAYFYWSIREQGFPVAFQKVLEEIKAEDLSDFLEINIHLTSAESDDFKTTMARVANALSHEQGGRDEFIGIQSPLPCFFGRPDWTKVFTKVALENPGGGDVGVFVCGPSILSMEINSACIQFNGGSKNVVNPSSTKFVFNKEVF